MLEPQKLPKIDQDAKTIRPRPFFDSQEAKNDDSGPPRKRRPKTASPKTSILDDFWSFLNDFLRGFCITCRCWQCVQKVWKKPFFPPRGVLFHSHGKTLKKHAKNDTFPWKIDPKTRPPKILPKTSIFELFRGSKKAESRPFWSWNRLLNFKRLNFEGF